MVRFFASCASPPKAYLRAPLQRSRGWRSRVLDEACNIVTSEKWSAFSTLVAHISKGPAPKGLAAPQPKLALTPELCGGLLQLDGRIGSPILVAQPRCRTTAAARGRTRSRCSLSAARPRSRPVSAGCQQLTHAPELAMKLRKTYCSRRFWIQHAEALVDLVGQRGRMHAGSRKRSTKKRVRNLSFAAKACTRHANDREDEETVDPYSTHCVRMDANGSGAVHTGASDPVDEPRRFSA